MRGMYGRNISIALISFSLAFFAASHAPAIEEEFSPVLALTLEEAINLAFVANRDIQIQERELIAARAGILGAQSKFLPRLDIDGGYVYNEAVLTPFIPHASGAKKDVGVIGGYRNDNLWKVVLSEELYKGGAHIANFREAETNLKIQEETLRARKLDIEFETKRLYHGLQLAYETERIAADLVYQAEEHYEDVNSRYNQGTSSRFDLLQSKVHVAKTVPPLVKAENEVTLIGAELKKLLTVRIWDPIEIKEPLECLFIEIAEGDFLDLAYIGSPEMALKELGVNLKEWSIKMAQSGNLPSIDLSASYIYRSNSLQTMFGYKHTNWTAGIQFKIPIYDGFSTKAEVEEARARYAQAILQKEDIIEQTAVDIRRASLGMEEAQAIIISQEDNLVEANEAVRLSEVRYDNGVGTNLDVLDTQVSLSQVEQNLADGIYQYLMARAYLDRVMGLEFYKEDYNE